MALPETPVPPVQANASSGAPKYIWVPALGFAVATLVFVGIAFFKRPDLTPDQRTIMNFLLSFLAGMASLFLGGTALLNIRGNLGPLEMVFSATAGVAVFIFCYTHPLFTGNSPLVDKRGDALESPANEDELKVLDLQDQITDLRVYLESVSYPESRRKLSTAEDLANAILSFDDRKLNPRRKYIKHEYASYGYVMAAAAEENGNVTKCVKLAQAAVREANICLGLMAEAEPKYGIEENARFLVDWVRRDEGRNRVLYLKAMALCLAAKATRNTPGVSEVRETWDQITTSYKQDFPASSTPQLAWCITEEAKK